MYSAYKLNKQDDNIQPSRTPFPIWKQSVAPCPKLLFPDLHTDFSGDRSGSWYFYLFQNFSQFIVIHTVKGSGITNKAEIDVFLELSCFFQQMLAIWSLVPLPFLKPAWPTGSSRFTYCWSLTWRILSITLWSVWCKPAAMLWGYSSSRMERDPHGKKLRPLANNQGWLAKNFLPPQGKLPLDLAGCWRLLLPVIH